MVKPMSQSGTLRQAQGRLWGTRFGAGSGEFVEDTFSGEGEHEAGEAAEEHADSDERADDPDRAGGPGAPDHDGEDEGDNAVD